MLQRVLWFSFAKIEMKFIVRNRSDIFLTRMMSDEVVCLFAPGRLIMRRGRGLAKHADTLICLTSRERNAFILIFKG